MPYVKGLLLSAIALLSLAGCSAEKPGGDEPREVVKVVITASVNPATKTYIGETEGSVCPLYWSDGDRIAVGGKASSEAVISTDRLKAAFEALVPSAEKYTLIYPYTEGNAADEVTFDGVCLPACSVTSALRADVILRPLFCVLRLQVTGEDTINRIVLSTQDSAQVCGKFRVGDTGLPDGLDPKATELVLIPPSPVVLNPSTPSRIDLVVPAGTYNIFNLTLFDSEGNSMTKKLGYSGYIAAAGAVKEFPEFEYGPSDFTIGTYNLWAVSARKWSVEGGAADEARLWSNSRDAVVRYITELNLDILGVQEADPEQISYLTSELEKNGPGYSQILFWPDANHSKQSADGIFYRSKRFELVTYHQYWISPSPEVQSYGWDESGYRYRNAGYCHFLDKRTDRHIAVTVTHGPQGDTARYHSALLMKEYERKLNTDRYPAFFIGDMNAVADKKVEDPFNTEMRAYCEDSYRIAEKTNGQPYTFVGSSSTAAPSRRIDYIYIHDDKDVKPYTVKEYAVGVDKYDIGGTAYYPSDHCPVYIKVVIK